MTDQARIYQQIEQTADFYGPDVYSVLTTYYTFESQDDALAAEYIPLSAAYRSAKNAKLFAVGLIPPSANVSGRKLDRSASIAVMTGTGQEAELGGDPAASGGVTPTSGLPAVDGYKVPPATGSANGLPAASNPGKGPNGGPANMNNLSVPQLWNVLGEAYRKQFGHDPTPTELQFYVAQSMRETGGKWPNNNPGYIGNWEKEPAGKDTFKEKSDGHYYQSYDTPQDGAAAFIRAVTRNPNTVAAAQQGDALGYLTGLAQSGYYGASVSMYYDGGHPNQPLFPTLLANISCQMRGFGLCLPDGRSLPHTTPDGVAYKETIEQYRARIAKGDSLWRFNSKSPYGQDDYGMPPSMGDATGSTPGWSDTGAENAAASKKEQDKTANTDLNQTELGKKFQQAQEITALVTKILLDAMANTPPLQLMVAPQSFRVSGEKIMGVGNYSRTGPVIEVWGDGQDKIEGSGKIAGFYAIDMTNGNGPGLNRTARAFSQSYQNLMSLYLLYRNNAGIYLGDFSQGNPDRFNYLSIVGSIYIYYDGVLYIGSFDSFNISEADATPFTLEYTFSFTVRAWFLLDIETPKNMGYGASELFTLPKIPTVTPAKSATPDPIPPPANTGTFATDASLAQQAKEEKGGNAIKNNPVGKNPSSGSGSSKTPSSGSGSGGQSPNATPQDKKVPTNNDPPPPPEAPKPSPPPGWYKGSDGQWHDEAGNVQPWNG